VIASGARRIMTSERVRRLLRRRAYSPTIGDYPGSRSFRAPISMQSSVAPRPSSTPGDHLRDLRRQAHEIHVAQVKPALEWEVEKLHEHQDHDGAPGEGAGEARIIAGRLSDTSGPAHTFTPVNVWDVRLNGGAEARLPLPEGHTAMIVVLSGRVSADDDQVAGAAQMILFDRSGEGVVLGARCDATLLVLTGEPIEEPIVGYGPFVMNSEAEIRQAVDDFNSGRFAEIAGAAHPAEA
jgi:hypothetical protein